MRCVWPVIAIRCLSAAFRVRFQSSFVRQSPVTAASLSDRAARNSEHWTCYQYTGELSRACDPSLLIFRSVQGCCCVPESQCQGRCSLSSSLRSPRDPGSDIWHEVMTSDIWCHPRSVTSSLLIVMHPGARAEQITGMHLNRLDWDSQRNILMFYLISRWFRIILLALIGFDTMSILFAFIRAVEDIWMPWFPLPCSVNK